jgi:hypothetical protein
MPTQSARSLAVPFAVALLVLGLFGSAPLTRWARDLPVGPVSARVVGACDAWNRLMKGLGLTEPYRRLNRAAERLQSWEG